MRRILPSAAVLAALFVTSTTSYAAIITPHNPPSLGDTTVTVNGVSQSMQSGTPSWHGGTDTSDPAANYWVVPTTEASYSVGGGVVKGVAIQYEADPIIGYSISVDNLTNAPMVIDTTKTVIVSVLPAPTQYKGSIGITLTDNNLDGALVTDSGVPVYEASIDGNPVLDLFNPVYTFSVVPTDTQTDLVNSPFFGGGPAITATLSIHLRLTLSPHDSVAITSNFLVVPEPASLALLGLGAVGLLRRRRR